MATRRHVTAVLAGLALMAGGAQAAAQDRSTIGQIRNELLQLPYYGVFDFLAFKYDPKGVVTLMGFAYHSALKSDAEHAVRRVSGVKEVGNKIEELSSSPNDDDLRWKTYYAIYRDPFLSRYAPGGGTPWGHRHGFTADFRPLGQGPFVGMEPAGDYPIHIIVKNGRIALYGVVDNDSDRTVAEMKARQIPGSLGVDNYLMVEKGPETAKS
jgi:hyperosmotically inducible protein